MGAEISAAAADAEFDAVDGEVLDLRNWIPYRCSAVANRVSTCLQSMYEERFALTVPGWRVMATLGRYAPLSAKEVADHTAMDQVQVTRAINHMAALGLVSRRTDTADRRRIVLRLSKKGLAAYREIAPLALSIERALLADFTKAEQAQLAALTAKLLRAAEKTLPQEVAWQDFR